MPKRQNARLKTRKLKTKKLKTFKTRDSHLIKLKSPAICCDSSD